MAATADPSVDVPAGRFAHLAGFFAARADLVVGVVDFVVPALRDTDGAVVVVATPDHQTAIVDALKGAGIDPRPDRCVFLDVDAVLTSLLRGGVADRDRLRATVGGALDEHLEAGRDVRVYAELAGRLWERGEVTAAMQVEELADELARDRSFVLLCAYPTHLFGEQDADVGALATVCDVHTGLVHGDRSGTDAAAGRVHLAEVVQRQAVARAIDHQRLRDERDALRTALQDAANQPRQEFTAMVVHDLRTPTTVIAGLTRVLQQRMAELEPARVVDFLETILRNAERIERLLDDILTVAQLESGGFGYDLAPVDLRAVVAEVATAVHQIRGRVVDVSADPGLPLAMADADRQVQVLHNLLSNAAKFSRAGTPISLRIEHRGDHLAVHIRDHGRGIATADLDRLFEPFARLDRDEADKVDGTGLGLYVTRALVEGQGGTIAIASTPGQGTTVTYTVPVVTTAQDHAGSAAVPDMPVPEDRPLASSTAVGRPPGMWYPGSPTRSDDARTENELLEQLAQIAHRLSEADDVDDLPFDLDELLHRLMGHATEVVEAAGAGIMLAGERGDLGFVAASEQRVVEAEQHQVKLKAGACFEAFTTNRIVTVDDLNADRRWPDYAHRVASLGLLSVLGVPMKAFGQTIGAIDFYRETPSSWTPEDIDAAKIVTSMGAGYVMSANHLRAQHMLSEQLHAAIRSRDIIGQAKGVLMARNDVSADSAFETLRERSQHENRKLADLAQEIVADHELHTTSSDDRPNEGV